MERYIPRIDVDSSLELPIVSYGVSIALLSGLARIFHEVPSRDHEDGRAT